MCAAQEEHRGQLRGHAHDYMSFAETCAIAMRKEGVLGVLCVDSQGLCLHSEGEVPDGCSGAVAEMALRSLTLAGDDAVVTVEAAERKVVISRSDSVTIALFMSPKA